MKTRRLIVIGILIIIALGRIMPMTLMPEPWDPWYIDYTTIWFFLAGFLLYPSALVTHILGLSSNRCAFLIVDIAWLIILCLIVYFFPFRATPSSQDDLHQ